jgi:transcriptional regulator with XRE-family HTH domain
MEIGRRIKEIRTAVGITQVKFAERIAISTSYISEIENGLKVVNERTIRLIIAEYNVNEDWLRTGKGVMFKEDVSASVSEAMRMFKALAPDFQDGALKILTILTEMNNKIKSDQNKE